MFKTLADQRNLRFSYADTRRWVMIGSSTGAVGYGAMLIVNVIMWGLGPTRHQFAMFAAGLACVAGGLTARRGQVFRGGLIGLCAATCESLFSLGTAPDFPSPTLLATAVTIVSGSLLLRPRPSALLALVAIVAVWPLALLSPGVRAIGATPTVLFFLVGHSVVMTAVWLLVSLGLSVVDRAFVEVVRNERALSETIDRSPDGILVIDASEVLQVINPAATRMLGVSRDDGIGRPIAELVALAAESPERQVPLSVGASGEQPYPWAITRQDGTRVDLEVTGRGMDSGRRQLVLRDVSDRVRAEQVRRDMALQLAHAQRLEAVGQLAGGIAHDFNNILTIIGASAEVLRDEAPDESLAPLIDDILAAQDRGATLTRQLLAFARREVVQPRVLDLSAHILSLQRLLQRVAGEQTRIACDVEPGCRVQVDIGQLEQALVNLVSNARDAMPDGGTCTISVVRMTNDDGSLWVRLRVRDAGVGMDAATIARAFEPFFTTKPRGRGTGLGLAAVHGMALQSGGRAVIESQPTLGTTILLEFPFSTAPATIVPTRATAAHASGGGTILVAEDDDGTRASVSRLLERLGYTVLLAPDGIQALRMAELNGGRIDLLLTDVMMPGLTGPQLAARLRGVAPHVPVIFMSGYPEDALAEVPGLQLETDFVAKPFASATLARRVAEKLAVAVAAAPEL